MLPRPAIKNAVTVNASPCRVLYIAFDGSIGGSLANMLDFVKHSSKRDFRVTLCLLGKEGATSHFARLFRVEVVSFNAESGLDMKGFFCLRQFLKKRSFDVIHNNARTYFSHVALRFAAMRTPKVYQEHGDLHTHGNEQACRIFYRVFSRIYDLFLTVSKETLEEMVKIGVPKARIINIANPVDLSYFRPKLGRREAKKKMGFGPDFLIIGSACRLVHQKDLTLFLSAAAHICSARQDVRFVIAGEGNEEYRLKRLAESLKIDNRVKFIGSCMDMPTLWRCFDIFLLTSHQESFGRTILESLASATPIVGVRPRMGGGEIVDRADGVRVIRGRDPKILAAAALQLCEYDHLRHSLGKRGRQWVERQDLYGVQNWTRRLGKVYAHISHRAKFAREEMLQN